MVDCCGVVALGSILPLCLIMVSCGRNALGSSLCMLVSWICCGVEALGSRLPLVVLAAGVVNEKAETGAEVGAEGRGAEVIVRALRSVVGTAAKEEGKSRFRRMGVVSWEGALGSRLVLCCSET
jgi:hypothetical protein